MGTLPPLLLEMLLRRADSLYDRESVQRYLQLLVSRGFRVITQDEDILYQQVVPGVSLMAQQMVNEYLTQHQADLPLLAYYLGHLTLEIWFTFKPEESAILFVVEKEHFFGDEKGRMAYMALLDLFKETYVFWHPFYGYELFSNGEQDGVQPERMTLLATHEIHHLYNINFLGPEIVAKFGRERLLGSSAWRSELLSDGGVLLLPTDITGITVPFGFKRVAVAFGLQTPQAPGEEWEEDKYTDPALW